MAKIKWDVSDVEDIPEREHAPVGTYRAKIVSCEAKKSSKDNDMLECRWTLTHDASGKKLKTEFNDIWEYPILDHDHPFVQNKLKEFIRALGLKAKGTMEAEKLVGKTAQVKLKSDTDQDGEYRPRIGKYMPVTAEEPEDEEEPDTDDAEEEEAEDEDGEEVDLDSMSRKELKEFIKEEELEVRVLKSMSDDDLREAIQEAMGDDEEEEEEPDDDEEEDDDEDEADDEEEGDNYDEMSAPDLKAALKERELPTTGTKKVLIQRLRKDDGDSPF
jgi:hypothetical protein